VLVAQQGIPACNPSLGTQTEISIMYAYHPLCSALGAGQGLWCFYSSSSSSSSSSPESSSVSPLSLPAQPPDRHTAGERGHVVNLSALPSRARQPPKTCHFYTSECFLRRCSDTLHSPNGKSASEHARMGLILSPFVPSFPRPLCCQSR
jgi:hypothetical protein